MATYLLHIQFEWPEDLVVILLPTTVAAPGGFLGFLETGHDSITIHYNEVPR